MVFSKEALGKIIADGLGTSNLSRVKRRFEARCEQLLLENDDRTTAAVALWKQCVANDDTPFADLFLAPGAEKHDWDAALYCNLHLFDKKGKLTKNPPDDRAWDKT
jgi:hypothetical protein